jgi:enoyl-CoA hydratase/carnithine racemase
LPNDIHYGSEGPVATISIDRAERRNALTEAMLYEILAAAERAEADDEVKAVVLRGEGPAFCAGFDLSDPAAFYGDASESSGQRHAIRVLRRRAELMRSLFLSMKPIVARVQGSCIGVGSYLLLVSRFAIVSEDAVFGFPEERHGSAGAVWVHPFLVAQCGLKRANELVTTGRRIEAEEAERLGLVNRVVPADQLDEEVDELVAALCSLPRDGLAISAAVQHLGYALLGISDAFLPHYATAPMSTKLERDPGDFDFGAAVEEQGLRGALQERERAFGGRYWRW